jgi:hypothetical protein
MGEGGGTDTNTTQTQALKSGVTAGPVSFGAITIGSDGTLGYSGGATAASGSGSNTLLWVAVGALAVLAFVFFKRK